MRWWWLDLAAYWKACRAGGYSWRYVLETAPGLLWYRWTRGKDTT